LGPDREPHLGLRSWRRVDKAGHMIAVEPPVRILFEALEPTGSSTHGGTLRFASNGKVTGALDGKRVSTRVRLPRLTTAEVEKARPLSRLIPQRTVTAGPGDPLDFTR